MNLRERLLGNTFAYKTFKNLVSPPHLVAKTIEEFLQIADGLSVLDLGCGYGDIAHFYANRCKYVGIDSNEYQGFAFGLGLERFAMLKYDINDLRQFFEGDIRWLNHYNFSALDIPSIVAGLTK